MSLIFDLFNTGLVFIFDPFEVDNFSFVTHKRTGF